VWTLVLEEHFAQPWLLEYIKPYRRDIYAQDRAKASVPRTQNTAHVRRARARSFFYFYYCFCGG
jgi:hypothetical protein